MKIEFASRRLEACFRDAGLVRFTVFDEAGYGSFRRSLISTATERERRDGDPAMPVITIVRGPIAVATAWLGLQKRYDETLEFNRRRATA